MPLTPFASFSEETFMKPNRKHSILAGIVLATMFLLAGCGGGGGGGVPSATTSNSSATTSAAFIVIQ